jgi:hypothetical protein
MFRSIKQWTTEEVQAYKDLSDSYSPEKREGNKIEYKDAMAHNRRSLAEMEMIAYMVDQDMDRQFSVKPLAVEPVPELPEAPVSPVPQDYDQGFAVSYHQGMAKRFRPYLREGLLYHGDLPAYYDIYEKTVLRLFDGMNQLSSEVFQGFNNWAVSRFASLWAAPWMEGWYKDEIKAIRTSAVNDNGKCSHHDYMSVFGAMFVDKHPEFRGIINTKNIGGA